MTDKSLPSLRPLQNWKRLSESERYNLALDMIEDIIRDVTNETSIPVIRADLILPMLMSVERHSSHQPERAQSAQEKIIIYVTKNWSDFADPLARIALDDIYSNRLYSAFPRLRSDITTIRAVSWWLTSDKYSYSSQVPRILAEIKITSLCAARILILAIMKIHSHSRQQNRREQDNHFLILFAKLGNDIGWTPWVKLFGLLLAVPTYADPDADTRVESDPSKIASEIISAQRLLSEHLGSDHAVRAIAARLLDLIDVPGRWSPSQLLERPPETRSAFVASLLKAVAGDSDLRHAVIEALLWLPDRRAAELGHFSASRLIGKNEETFLEELSNHPEHLVGYAANAIKNSIFGSKFLGDISLPITNTIAPQSVYSIGTIGPRENESAKTWLGDRTVELLIEHTVSGVEMRFAREYEDHGEEGEERLLTAMFEALSTQFDILNKALQAAARATSATRTTHINMRYRPVDKAEEGRKGIKNSKRFSTDLCLIVDPFLDDRPLGRRVTLVQAKRLYRDKNAVKQPTWHHSFHLKVSQLKDLIKQTHSAVYFFQGPFLGGRGVPVIPAQLVSDLANHQGGSGAELARDTVAVASRSLADWFTYDAMALRVGDPLEELVQKAEGTQGAKPRRLLALPRVEVAIKVSSRSEESGR